MRGVRRAEVNWQRRKRGREERGIDKNQRVIIFAIPGPTRQLSPPDAARGPSAAERPLPLSSPPGPRVFPRSARFGHSLHPPTLFSHYGTRLLVLPRSAASSRQLSPALLFLLLLGFCCVGFCLPSDSVWASGPVDPPPSPRDYCSSLPPVSQCKAAVVSARRHTCLAVLIASLLAVLQISDLTYPASMCFSDREVLRSSRIQPSAPRFAFQLSLFILHASSFRCLRHSLCSRGPLLRSLPWVAQSGPPLPAVQLMPDRCTLPARSYARPTIVRLQV